MKAAVSIFMLLWSAGCLAQADTSRKALRTIADPARLKQIGDQLRFQNEKTRAPELNQLRLLDATKQKAAAPAEQLKQGYQKLEEKKAELTNYTNMALVIEVAIEESSEEDVRNKTRLHGPSQYDSRLELRQLDPLVSWQRQILNNAQNVGLVIRRENLTRISDSLYQINTGLTLGERYQLCPGEAFADQPVAGEGTAFLFQKQYMASAAHVFSAPPSAYAVIFNFELINKTGAYTGFVSAKDIYYPTEVAYRDVALDMMVFKLNRPADRPGLRLSAERTAKIGTEVYMIGHPSGLPQKVAVNASVRSLEGAAYFYTSLDAFQGNSGSPVFDRNTGQVIGILVSGTSDYAWNGSCNVTTLCRIPFCTGEKVTGIYPLVEAMAWVSPELSVPAPGK
jgi:S1-C subfamily serine protease